MPVSTSTVISRTSSRRNSHSCTNSPAPLKLLVLRLVTTKRIVPLELVDLIARYAYLPKCSFAPLLGFASASIAFHTIALRIACTHLCAFSASRWSKGLPDTKDMRCWVKTLHGACVALAAPEATFLRSFDSLLSVHISFIGETILTVGRIIFPVLNNLPSTLTELSLTNLPDANIAVLTSVAVKFSGLRRLELSCAERLDPACCWTCFEESASSVWHSPIPDLSSTAEELTASLKSALMPLTHLEHLHLGFFLSPEELFYEHIEHAQEISTSPSPNSIDADVTADATLPFGPEWCIDCFERYAPAVRLVELQAALSLAQALKELRTVSWASFFGRQKQEMEGRRTTIWVGRVGGHIRVRRKPFDA